MTLIYESCTCRDRECGWQNHNCNGYNEGTIREGVQPFKVGPDYIDPSYHTMATGNTSRNLDSFFMSDGQIREAFIRAMEISGARMGVIEGVRGLYEGISPVNDVGSTASVAKALNAPVVLIINSRSLVKSAAAIVLGFRALDPEVRIKGVILNQVKNRRHYLKTKRAVEELADTPVIGESPGMRNWPLNRGTWDWYLQLKGRA